MKLEDNHNKLWILEITYCFTYMYLIISFISILLYILPCIYYALQTNSRLRNEDNNDKRMLLASTLWL